MHTFGFYNTRDYIWKNDTLKNLPEELSDEDKKIFFCDYKAVNTKLLFVVKATLLQNWL